MNVFFDDQIFCFQRYGGISKYFFELSKELKKIKDCHPEILAPYHYNAYLNEPGGAELVYKMNPILKKLYDNRFISKRAEVNKGLIKKKCNSENSILHETYYIERVEVKAKKVVTIHDMIYELLETNLADRQQTIDGKKLAMHEADAIISVSENTKRDILKFYPEVAGKIHVVHHGVSQFDLNNIKPFTHPAPYILYVGDRAWYKNFDKLLDLYCSQKNINQNFDLVCFGGGNATMEQITRIKTADLLKNIHFLNGNDSVLNSLYRGAKAFVYISAYEGFGMPVLEAMALGCPVLCSNSSSLPEVAGEAAKIIDPNDPEGLRGGLNEVLFDEDSRKKLIDSGLKRAKLFTWTKCALETHEVYKKVLGEL